MDVPLPILLTELQAAKLLGVHPDTLRRMVEAGKLNVVRLGKTGRLRRYRPADIAALSKAAT